ncbi:hypothetical protein [Diplocloster agilis]|nr:hypothetical protein [Diplocloster agilis]
MIIKRNRLISFGIAGIMSIEFIFFVIDSLKELSLGVNESLK